MTLKPLTIDEFRIITPAYAADQWSLLGQRLETLVRLDSEADEVWRQQKLIGLMTALQLYTDLSFASWTAPIETWHLMAKTLKELVDNSEGGYLLGVASALSLQLDVSDMKTRC